MDRIHITPSTSVVLAPRRDGDGHSEVLSARGAGKSIAAFCKKNVVLIVATIAAAVSWIISIGGLWSVCSVCWRWLRHSAT